MNDKAELDFLEDLTSALKAIQGVAAVVLGGSRAKGTHHPGSDFDLGLYYDPASPPDPEELCKIAKRYDDRRQDDLFTPIGEWGPWINGGGWLKVKSMQVDLLYRDLSIVKTVFEECLNGQVSIAYQPGHPHGFVSSIYFAEIAECQILCDELNILSELKAKTTPYPSALQKGTVQKFLWEAEFALAGARKGIPYADVSYVAGSCYRALSCLNQVLFALNERYWMNEKGAVRAISKFPICPPGFEKRVNNAFSKLWPGRKYLIHGIRVLTELLQETTALVGK